MVSHNTLEIANQRAEILHKTLPRAVSARYDRAGGKIVIDLSSKLSIGFSPRDAQGLEHAKPLGPREDRNHSLRFRNSFPQTRC